jgi:hypothetical protein
MESRLNRDGRETSERARQPNADPSLVSKGDVVSEYDPDNRDRASDIAGPLCPCQEALGQASQHRRECVCAGSAFAQVMVETCGETVVHHAGARWPSCVEAVIFDCPNF